MGWLSGWTYRIELTIDSTKVDDDLTDFPVMIDVPAAVFNRFSGDSDRKKIAVTTSDGTTQCYVEIDHWDHASTKGFLHAKIPSILAASDTTIYLYYDPSQSENTTYVGDTGDAAAQTVWNSGWALVYHCAQDPSGGADCVLDSTPNENHGTPNGSAALTHIDGLIGKAYQGDGSDGAYIEVPHHASLEPTHITIELVAKSRSAGTQYIIDKKTGSLGVAGSGAYLFGVSSVGSTGLSFTISDATSANRLDSGTDNVFRNQDAWAKVNLFYENLSPSDNDQSIDVNITEKSSDTTSIDMSGSAEILRVMNGHTDNKFIGDLCELRISSVARSAAWRKAAYYTLFNTLLTYGSEEEGGGAEETELVDVSLNLSAYHQDLEDFAAWLRAHDGLEFEDVKTLLAALAEDTEDLPAHLSAYYQDLEDLKLHLQTWAWRTDDVKTLLEAQGLSLTDVSALLRAVAYRYEDIKTFLSAVDSIVLTDLAAYLSATDGTVNEDVALYLAAIALVPAYRAVTAQRLSSVISEVS